MLVTLIQLRHFSRARRLWHTLLRRYILIGRMQKINNDRNCQVFEQSLTYHLCNLNMVINHNHSNHLSRLTRRCQNTQPATTEVRVSKISYRVVQYTRQSQWRPQVLTLKTTPTLGTDRLLVRLDERRQCMVLLRVTLAPCLRLQRLVPHTMRTVLLIK